MYKIKYLFAALVILLPLLLFPGCKRQQNTGANNRPVVTLTYYKAFDNEDVLKPLFQEFQSKNPHIRIQYRKFTDFDEYTNLILNELAEGEGPDIFSMPNTWIAANTKKLVPAPLEVITPAQAEQVFVSAAAKDILQFDKDGEKKMFGAPLTVDTLALYYNKAHFDDAIPEKGAPSSTWEALKEDVFRLSKKDNSFERFFRAGIALGRSDNIARATDIVYLLMLQYRADIYDDNYKAVKFARSIGTPPVTPGAQALDLFVSFAVPDNKNYSWNAFLAQAENPEKELAAFVTGKVSMIVNYSFAYQQIIDLIKTKRASGLGTIDPENVKVASIPQVFDPAVSPDKRVSYASYFVEVVGRNSKHPQEAWQLLSFLAGKNSLQHYFEKTKKPTSRRDLIEAQAKEPIYGVFVNQIGYAETFPLYDRELFSAAIKKAIDETGLTGRAEQAVRTAERLINEKLPTDGFVPLPPPKKP